MHWRAIPRLPDRPVRTLATALFAALTLVYPLLVFVGLGRWSPVWIALALAMLALLRAWATRQWIWLVASGGAGLLALASAAGGGWLPVKLYPVLVNAVLLTVFGASLLRGPSAIERLARLSEPDLPPAAVVYTRRVTQVWCLFFVGNGSAALVTALWASTEVWALYNGLVAYVLMGLLFAGEWLLRQRFKSRQVASEVRHG